MGHHCCSKQKVKRGLWSPEEDEKLIRHITTQGHGCWSSVPKLAGLQRCGKSCRLRWINYLRPDLKRGSFSAQEERIIIDVHRILGNRWAQIAKHLPGRTDNEVKNFWNSCIKKKLIAQGLDPKTHNLISSHHITNNNACNHLIYQPPTSVFSANSQLRNGSIDMNPPFITLPHPPPPLPTTTSFQESITLPTYVYQNPNLVWNVKDQNSQVSFDLVSRSSMECTPISSAINSSGLGILNENCMWSSTNVEPFEPPRQEEMAQLQQEQKQQPGLCVVEFDETNEMKGGQDMETSFNTCNFDLDFVESTMMSSGMYSNVNSMDQLAWDC